MYESASVPWYTQGNRRGITEQQLFNNTELLEFVQRFSHCFEYNPDLRVYWFIESPENKTKITEAQI